MYFDSQKNEQQGGDMVEQRIRIVICLALCLLLVTGCEKAPEPTTEPRQETTLLLTVDQADHVVFLRKELP